MYSDTPPSDEPFLDTVEGEVVLFHAIARARPIGVNRHFHVMAIWLAIQKETQQRISIDDIWSKLRTLYDIDALNAIDAEAAHYEPPSSTSSTPVPIPMPTSSEDLYSHPYFKEEFALSTLPYDESIESMIMTRRMRATPSVATPSPSPAPKRPKPKGKTKRTKQLKDAGLVGGDSDSSALTQESGEDGAPTPKDSVFTGTDAGTEVDDEDVEMQDASPAPSTSKRKPAAKSTVATKKNAAKTRAATQAKKKKRK